MNFYSRRKILKRSNYLDLTPVRVLEHEPAENGKVDLLLPRFRNTLLKEMFRQRRKGETIRIHLDASGSLTWLAIDGKRSVRDICQYLIREYPDRMQPENEIETRVTNFLSLLYRERYITFREILPA